jgi:hypothetical protein
MAPWAWEARRWRFNMTAGAAGVFTLTTIQMIALIPPGIRMGLDWRPVVAYALLANVCYTFGFPVERVLKRLIRRDSRELGPMLFRQGLGFAIGLTLLPIVPMSLMWLARAAAWLAR